MTAPDEPRIRPGTRADLGWALWAVSRVAGVTTGTTTPNLFRTLGRHRRLCRGWLHFAGRLMPGGTLPRRETELVILRVAHLRDCRYEFDHHVRLGRRAGVRPADVDRVVAGPEAAGWTHRERAVLAAVDQLLVDHDVDDERWRALREHLTEEQAVELCLLVGHYAMLATTIGALRIAPDRPRSRLRAVLDGG